MRVERSSLRGGGMNRAYVVISERWNFVASMTIAGCSVYAMFHICMDLSSKGIFENGLWTLRF